MDLLPTSLGTRPRLAVEIRPEGVVAARSEDAAAVVSAVAYGMFAEGVVTPGLKAGNVSTSGAGRAAAVAAVRKALEAVALKERQTTLVVPDAAVRVLLLDFDALPTKAAEALPMVRFRLKKLLPFDADDAVVSYQVMSSAREMIRVLAVAVPAEVLAEYEGVVREAGFEPGAVLPSTLAACAGMTEMETAALLVNAGESSVTTAIVQDGILLLHRTVDLAADGFVAEPTHRDEAAMIGAQGVGVGGGHGFVAEVPVELLALPLVDEESSAGEWAMQEPLNGYGMVDDERISAAAAMQAERLAAKIRAEVELAPTHPTPPSQERSLGTPDRDTGTMSETQGLGGVRVSVAAREVTQAVSVAAAYFEDTLQSAPGVVLAVGTLGAETLGELVREAGSGGAEMRVREMIEPAMLTGGAVSSRVPRGWMAGVRGALRS